MGAYIIHEAYERMKRILMERDTTMVGKMTWTPNKPTQPGWYWYRFKGNSSWLEVREILEGGFWSTEDESGCTEYINVNELHGEWAGPIPEPEERR